MPWPRSLESLRPPRRSGEIGLCEPFKIKERFTNLFLCFNVSLEVSSWRENFDSETGWREKSLLASDSGHAVEGEWENRESEKTSEAGRFFDLPNTGSVEL